MRSGELLTANGTQCHDVAGAYTLGTLTIRSVRFYKEIAMNEEALNTSLRKFLKEVGVTSQREIEKTIREAIADGRLKGSETLSAKVVLTVDKIGLIHTIDGMVELQ